MDFLNDMLDGLWALRYVIAFCVVVALAAWLADALGARDDALAEIRDLDSALTELQRENARLRGQLAAARKRAPILRGRVVS